MAVATAPRPALAHEGRPRTWVRRYAPAELLAVAGALLGYLLVDGATGAPAAAAYGAAVGDNLAYYGVIATRELSARIRVARARGQSRPWAGGLGALGALIVEFGPAEALDGALVRPACTAAATAALGPALGVLVAKFAADLAFYVPVIIGYEWRRSVALRMAPTTAAGPAQPDSVADCTSAT